MNPRQLPEREQRILRLLIAGRTLHQTAHELELPHGTLKGYVATLYQHLGASNRVEAVVLATRAGFA